MSSLWIETTKEDLKTEVLNGNIETEICIIGAGIFGLTTAYYLGQCGKKVTVIEKERIGETKSGCRSAQKGIRRVFSASGNTEKPVCNKRKMGRNPGASENS